MYRASRGTSDILPEEQHYWRYIERRASKLCELYGYRRIDTPVFEGARLFIRGVGEGTDIVEKEMYTFEDRGGDLMTLRPEGTAPVCRAYLEHGMHNLSQPVRLYYIAPIFRYERPQAGRYRQHQQFGFEAIGEGDPALDAEVIEMAWQLFARLGLKRLYLVLNSIGCPKCRPTYLAQLRSYYGQYAGELCPDCRARLERNPLRLLDCKRESCQVATASAPRSIDYLCPECQEHFERLAHYLDLLKLPYRVNHRLVRGLDYYTRTVFEIQPEEEGAQSTLGGGGRYDGLIEGVGGRPTPAVGFAAGIERMVLNIKRQGISIPQEPVADVYLAYVGEGAKERAVELASRLRESGVGAILSGSNRSLKAQLRQANALGLTYALILGEDEVKRGVIILRDMAKAEQQVMTPEQALQSLRGVMEGVP